MDIKGSLTVNTDVVMGYTLALRASLTFPSLVPESIDFSLTQVKVCRQKSFYIETILIYIFNRLDLRYRRW